MNEKTRLQNILLTLKKTYPRAHIVLHYQNPWELLVSVVLSAQCTDVVVNAVTEKLFKKYPTLEAYEQADLQSFENDIKKTGFYHNKAKHILAAAHMVKTMFNEAVPNTMEQILMLPGVARKTANVVLGNAYHVVEGIAVDTHVIRLSQRLRLVPIEKISGKHPSEVFNPKSLPRRQAGAIRNHIIDFYKDADPVKIEKELMAIIPKNQWFSLTYQLIDHGRGVCKSQNPQCRVCPLRKLCPVARTT